MKAFTWKDVVVKVLLRFLFVQIQQLFIGDEYFSEVHIKAKYKADSGF